MNTEYWKSTLNNGEKAIYDRLFNAFKSFKEDVSCGNAKAKDVARIYEAVYNDHPELFYLSSSSQVSQSVGFLGKGDTVLHADYIFSLSEIRAYQSELNAIIQKLKARTTSLSEKEKEKIVCDYLIENTDYEINNRYNQNALTVLVKHKGQCSGISKAANLLLGSIGIETIYVSGEIDDKRTNVCGPHAWTIVKIDGEYHHLDVTSIIGCNPTKEKPFVYSYYNVSDEQIEKDHKWDRTNVPRCRSAKGDGTDLVIHSLYELREVLKAIDYSKTTGISFSSDIPCADASVLPNRVLQTALDVLKQMNKRMRVQIKALDKTFCLTFETV